MTKRFCDKCGKEIDTTKTYATVGISVRNCAGALGPEHKFDLCNSCMNTLLMECGEDNEDLVR